MHEMLSKGIHLKTPVLLYKRRVRGRLNKIGVLVLYNNNNNDNDNNKTKTKINNNNNHNIKVALLVQSSFGKSYISQKLDITLAK